MDQPNYQRKFILFYSAITLLFFLLYFQYWSLDPILQRDDVQLLTPLQNVTGLTDYVTKVANNTILDIQPARDLTYLVNIVIHDMTGFSTFHLTNFFIFLLSVYLFSRLMQRLRFSPTAILVTLSIYSLHPLMVSSIGWISSRKHSLALVFILMTLLSFFKENKIRKSTIAFYALSVFSHQIFIFFPFWLFIYTKIKKIKTDTVKMSILMIISLVVLFLGTYKTFYLGMGNTTYEIFSFSENVSRYVLSVGRSVSLILFPVVISAAYYQGSLLNILGITLLILVLYVFYKGKDRTDTFLWILLAASAHILTYIAFVNDTYLYLPLICLLIAGNYYFQDHLKPNAKKWHWAVLIIPLCLMAYKTVDASQMWRTDLKLWQYSHANEASPYSAILLGSHLLKKNEELGLSFLQWGAKNYNLIEHRQILVYFLSTVYTSSVPIQKKISILEDCYIDHELYKGYLGLSLLEGSPEQMQKGIQILKHVLLQEEKYVRGSEGHKVILSIKYLCKNFSGKNEACTQLGITY